MKKVLLLSKLRQCFTTTSQLREAGMRVRTGVRAGIVGRPATPGSVAGVARRTTRRTAYYY